MLDWIKKLAADAGGIPDELRAAFLAVQVFYLLAWAAWLATGHLSDWPGNIAAFSGGEAGIITAFGITARARGNN